MDPTDRRDRAQTQIPALAGIQTGREWPVAQPDLFGRLEISLDVVAHELDQLGREADDLVRRIALVPELPEERAREDRHAGITGSFGLVSSAHGVFSAHGPLARPPTVQCMGRMPVLCAQSQEIQCDFNCFAASSSSVVKGRHAKRATHQSQENPCNGVHTSNVPVGDEVFTTLRSRACSLSPNQPSRTVGAGWLGSG